MSDPLLGYDYPCGTYLAYRHNPCRCSRCTKAWTMYDAKRRIRHTRGEVWADMSYYRRILAPFIRAGVGPTAIARAVGADHNGGKAARKIMEGKGRVGTETARRFDGLTWDTLPDSVKVDASIARALVDELLGQGWSYNRIATDAIGWSRMGRRWPTTGKATLGVIRKMERVLGITEHGWHGERPCKDCDAAALAGGVWCLDCLGVQSLPQTRDEIELASRREDNRRRKAKYRSAA